MGNVSSKKKKLVGSVYFVCAVLYIDRCILQHDCVAGSKLLRGKIGYGSCMTNCRLILSLLCECKIGMAIIITLSVTLDWSRDNAAM